MAAVEVVVVVKGLASGLLGDGLDFEGVDAQGDGPTAVRRGANAAGVDGRDGDLLGGKALVDVHEPMDHAHVGWGAADDQP